MGIITLALCRIMLLSQCCFLWGVGPTRVSFDSEPIRRRHWERKVLTCRENREVEKAWDPFLPYLSISVFDVFITSKTKAKRCISRRLQASNVSSWFFYGTVAASPVWHFSLSPFVSPSNMCRRNRELSLLSEASCALKSHLVLRRVLKDRSTAIRFVLPEPQLFA